MGVARLPDGPGVPGAIHAPVQLHDDVLAQAQLWRRPHEQLAGGGAIEVCLPDANEGDI